MASEFIRERVVVAEMVDAAHADFARGFRLVQIVGLSWLV